MKDGHFVGIDISKKDFHTSLYVAGKWIDSKFTNNRKGYQKFVTWLSTHGQISLVCLEATGTYGDGVSSYLYNEGINVSVVNPMQIKHYAKSRLSRNKNDIVDARIIAEYGQKMSPVAYKPKSDSQKEAIETSNLIRTLKSQYGQLSNQLGTVSSKSIKLQISEQIEDLGQRISDLESSLNSLIQSEPKLAQAQTHLISIIGISYKSANEFLAHISNIEDFSSAKQLAAYMGLNPRQHTSGTYQGKTRLSKTGNAHLRKVLYMPALVARNRNPHFAAFCERLKDNGLSPKQIVCALMRKLVHIIFGMLKHQRDFDPALV